MTENSWEQFIETCRQGLAHTQQELKEIDLLIQQTSSELDRLMQANTHAVARRRQIESSFDTVPREDIRRAYTNLIESQQRLFTMRGQLEKLQSDQKHLCTTALLNHSPTLSFRLRFVNGSLIVTQREFGPSWPNSRTV